MSGIFNLNNNGLSKRGRAALGWCPSSIIVLFQLCLSARLPNFPPVVMTSILQPT